MIAVREGLVAQDREGGCAVGCVDYVDVVNVYRSSGVGSGKAQVPVDGVVQDRILGRILLHHLDGTDDEHIVLLEQFYYVPGVSQVDVLDRLVEECQRKIEYIAVAQVMNPVPGRADTYVVIADGEGVGPALQFAVHIPVEHQVLRKIIELHPLVRRYLKGPVYVLLQDIFPLVQHPLDSVGLSA